jgi:hypothetical protein
VADDAAETVRMLVANDPSWRAAGLRRFYHYCSGGEQLLDGDSRKLVSRSAE